MDGRGNAAGRQNDQEVNQHTGKHVDLGHAPQQPDRQLADARQIYEYFQILDRESNRITVREIGKTTEGNPFIVAWITSEANQQNLENYRQIQQKLADPRTLTDEDADRLIARGKTVVMINCSIHATEIGASQMALRLAYWERHMAPRLG